MLARIRPAAKIGHVIEGPTDHIRLDPKRKSLVLIDSSPALPVMENLGNRSAVATPTRAVAAAISRSAPRISGRRRSRSEGRPAGIRTAIASGSAIPGIGAI